MTYNKQRHAAELLRTIQLMGKARTNAVLMTLGNVGKIKAYQRYPETGYYFADQLWRVYYHSHGSTDHQVQEHGHFHFFAREAMQNDWSHVVAMHMNNMGLPTALFTTNQWVTDGPWLTTLTALSVLEQLEECHEDDLLLNWFADILLLFRNEIMELLFERDQQMKRLFPHDRDQGFYDRSVYYLSTKDIDLNAQIFEAVSQQPLASSG